MIRPIKHDKSTRHKKSRSFRLNIAVHPLVIVTILAAVTLVVLTITFFFFFLA